MSDRHTVFGEKNVIRFTVVENIFTLDNDYLRVFSAVKNDFGIHTAHHAVARIVELDNDTWVAAGMKYPGSTGGTDGAWSAGGTTRYFWVTRVAFSDMGYMLIDIVEGIW